jgi:hypothetical protein
MKADEWQRNRIALAHCRSALQRVPKELIDARIQPQPENVEAYINCIEGSQVGSGLGYMEEDEVKFVLETLEDIGLAIPCPGSFWRDLECAARTLMVSGPMWRYREQFRLALNRLKEGEEQQNDDCGI